MCFPTANRIDPVVLRVLGFEGHVPADESRSARNFLMFMNPANITYDQGPAALAHFLPTVHATQLCSQTPENYE